MTLLILGLNNSLDLHGVIDINYRGLYFQKLTELVCRFYSGQRIYSKIFESVFLF